MCGSFGGNTGRSGFGGGSGQQQNPLLAALQAPPSRSKPAAAPAAPPITQSPGPPMSPMQEPSDYGAGGGQGLFGSSGTMPAPQQNPQVGDGLLGERALFGELAGVASPVQPQQGWLSGGGGPAPAPQRPMPPQRGGRFRYF